MLLHRDDHCRTAHGADRAPRIARHGRRAPAHPLGFRAGLALALVLALGACSLGPKAPRPPTAEVAREQNAQYERAARRLRAHLERTSRVGARVKTAAAPFCADKRGPYVGVLTSSRAGLRAIFDPVGPWGELRRAAARVWGVGRIPMVLDVHPGSPASEAGVRLGDQIIGLSNAVDSTDPLLTISRAGTKRQLRLRNQPSCEYIVTVGFGDSVTASSGEDSVSVTIGMLRFVENDDELAMVIGHELAHRILLHRRRDLRRHERQADYLGAYLAARAGFDPDAGLTFWRRLAADSPYLVSGRLSPAHPGTAARAVALERTVAEIRAKRARGESLIPEGMDDLLDG